MRVVGENRERRRRNGILKDDKHRKRVALLRDRGAAPVRTGCVIQAVRRVGVAKRPYGEEAVGLGHLHPIWIVTVSRAARLNRQDRLLPRSVGQRERECSLRAVFADPQHHSIVPLGVHDGGRSSG